MSVLFGHPSGGPFSHHAALAHFEKGRLDAFCVPWMPSRQVVGLLENAGPLGRRFARRHFPPLASAPKIQGRWGELRRLAIRAFGRGDEGLSYEANDWLMETMGRECRRPAVTAVHSYEDCSLTQFAEAKRLGKACLYDMPIGYYPAWEQTQADLLGRHADWLPAEARLPGRFSRPEQKRREMELADLVLVPGSFVERTILSFHPGKKTARAPYGVDLEFWCPDPEKRTDKALRFICAGQLSIRKGIPGLLAAWEAAGLRDAELELVGPWQLAPEKRGSLPPGVTCLPPCSSEALRERYRAADVFLFPSFFEGFGLVLLEAMACGLPAVATDATAGPDVLDESCGRLVQAGDLDAMVESLRWFGAHRGQLPGMSRAARSRAETFTWGNYRRRMDEGVAPFI